MNNTFVVKNPLVWCDFEFGWWKNKFPLPSTKRNAQSSVPSKADGTKSRLQFQQAKSLSTEAFFENPSTVIDICLVKKKSATFSQHKKIRFCFRTWDDNHLEVFFPLADSSFFEHPFVDHDDQNILQEWRRKFLFPSIFHNIFVWGKTQLRRFVLIWLPHKGLTFRVVVCNPFLLSYIASSQETSSRNMSLSCCFKTSKQLRNANAKDCCRRCEPTAAAFLTLTCATSLVTKKSYFILWTK